MHWYRVKDLGKPFDGLLVYGDSLYMSALTAGSVNNMVQIERVIDDTIMSGDRNLSFTLPDDSVFINERFLERSKNPELREFASNNPFGSFVLEGSIQKENIKVVWAEYEKALQVTVLEITLGNSETGQMTTKTIYAAYYPEDRFDFDGVREVIYDMLKNEEDDDLIFYLKDLEKNG